MHINQSIKSHWISNISKMLCQFHEDGREITKKKSWKTVFYISYLGFIPESNEPFFLQILSEMLDFSIRYEFKKIVGFSLIFFFSFPLDNINIFFHKIFLLLDSECYRIEGSETLGEVLLSLVLWCMIDDTSNGNKSDHSCRWWWWFFLRNIFHSYLNSWWW